MQLTLFGGFQLFGDGEKPLAVSARKVKALLAWLALSQGQSHSRDKLALLLWEESGEVQARHSLRQALTGLRKILADDSSEALATHQEHIILNPGYIDVDILQFEALLAANPSTDDLSRAVALCRGEFLEGFNPRSNTYEEWLMTQRSHYRERAVAAMSRLLEHYLESQQLEAGIRLAIQLLGADPLREQTHRTLMKLYQRMNRPADALRQYRQCRRVLLRELGLGPEPETERLYRQISKARNRQDCAEPLLPATNAATEPAQACGSSIKSGQPLADRQLRQITVAHFHLAGYGTLISEDDPELVGDMLQRFLDSATGLASRFGGQVHHHHANAVTIVFGLEKAYGNEPEKALQMTLALLEANISVSAAEDSGLAVHCGLDCGSVLYDGRHPPTGAVFAQAEELARRERRIILSDAIYQGLHQSIQASRHPSGGWILEQGGQGPESGGEAPVFIGRSRELRQLEAGLQTCLEDGAGETFLIRGEAGIGKTRLVSEFTDRAETLDVTCHRALALDFGMESRAEPVATLMRRLLGVEDDASAEKIAERIEAFLGSHWDQEVHSRAMHALFRLPLPQGDMSQQEEREDNVRGSAVYEIMDGILASASREKARMLIVEDIHWAGRQTLTYLAELASMVSRCKALLIITSRVEGEPLDPAWRGAMHGAPLTTLDLGPLRPDQALCLAQEIKGVDTEFANHCVVRSGGNPFFLEQLLWGNREQNGAVPSSVQSLVLNRLDMLPESDRQAAQAASILGQRFRSATLQHLLGKSDYRLDRLLKQRLIRPEVEGYLFGHALLKDGIYASILPSRRKALHLKAAEWYRESDPMLYARHLDLANDERAAQACLQAARLAITAFDFEQAKSISARGTEIAADPGLKTTLRIIHGELLVQSGELDEANQVYESAVNSAVTANHRCHALIGLATSLTVQDQLDRALETLDQAAPLAAESADQGLLIELHYRRGDILFALARADECLDAHRRAEHLSKEANEPLLEIRALAGMADAYYARGQMQAAFSHLDRCIELSRREKRLPQELGNLSMRGLTRFYTGSTAKALEDEREAGRLAARYGNLRAEMSAHMDVALIGLYTNDVAESEQAGRRALALAEQLGASRFYGDCLIAIGEALPLQGQLDSGLAYMERAYQAALDSVPTHICAFILGVLARFTPDENRRREAIEQGQRFLDAGSLSHNYLHFYQNLIEVSLQSQDPEGMLHYASALADYTRHEPMTWSDFYISRGRLLARAMTGPVGEKERQRARELLSDAHDAGYYFGTPELAELAAD